MNNRYRGMSARSRIAVKKEKLKHSVILACLAIVVIATSYLWVWFGIEIITIETKQDELSARLAFHLALIGSLPLCLLMTLKGE